MGRGGGDRAGESWMVGRGMVGMAAAGVGPCSGGAGREQLDQVVGGADERPLGFDLDDPTQQELPEATRLL